MWEFHTLEREDPARAAWEAVGEQILDGWKHGDTRPYGWWLFSSGLVPLSDPNYRGLLLHLEIPADQRAWLAEHDLLQEGEL